jgi:hypothetical protein
MNFPRITLLLLLAAGTAAPVAAHDVVGAAEHEVEEVARDFSVDFAPYVWVANINGTTTASGVSIIDILSALNGMVMMDLEMHYKRLGVIADGAWMELTINDSLPGPPPPGVWTDASVNLGVAFGTGAMSWQFRPRKGLTLDPYLGARWWRIHPTIALSGGSGVFPPTETTDEVATFADFIVGMRVKYDITPKWRAKFTGDVGGGVSKVQWQAYLAGGYAFTSWFEFEAGYRAMGVDRDQPPINIDIMIHGLQIGFHFIY